MQGSVLGQAVGSLRDSARELKRTRTMVSCAMLIAIQVVLDLFVALPIGSMLRISFGYLAVAAAGALFGPVPAMCDAILVDLLVFAIRPTGPYFVGFTVSAALGGLIYGLLFYRQPVGLLRILCAKAAINVFVNIGLNTLWLNLLYGQAFWVILPMRALKNAVQLPVDVVLLAPLILWLRNITGRGAFH